MRDRSFGRVVLVGLAGLGARIRDVLYGASGLTAYEQYLGHLRARHPDVAPMSREEFFRNDLTARWNGVRRCC